MLANEREHNRHPIFLSFAPTLNSKRRLRVAQNALSVKSLFKNTETWVTPLVYPQKGVTHAQQVSQITACGE